MVIAARLCWLENEDQVLIDRTLQDIHDQAMLIQREIFATRNANDPAYDELREAHYQVMRDADMLMPQSSVPY